MDLERKAVELPTAPTSPARAGPTAGRAPQAAVSESARKAPDAAVHTEKTTAAPPETPVRESPAELAALASELAGDCPSREQTAFALRRISERRSACLDALAELRSGAALLRAELALAGLRLEGEALRYAADAADAPPRAVSPERFAALSRSLRRQNDAVGTLRRRITALESALLIAQTRERRCPPDGERALRSAALQGELDAAKARFSVERAAQLALRADWERASIAESSQRARLEGERLRLRRQLLDNAAERERMETCCRSLKASGEERCRTLRRELEALEEELAAVLAAQARRALLDRLHESLRSVMRRDPQDR